MSDTGKNRALKWIIVAVVLWWLWRCYKTIKDVDGRAAGVAAGADHFAGGASPATQPGASIGGGTTYNGSGGGNLDDDAMSRLGPVTIDRMNVQIWYDNGVPQGGLWNVWQARCAAGGDTTPMLYSANKMLATGQLQG